MPGENGDRAGPEPMSVQPVPTPFGWGVHRGQVNVDSVIVLVFDTITGKTVLFLDDETAKEMGRQLTQKSTGLHLPPSGSGSGRIN